MGLLDIFRRRNKVYSEKELADINQRRAKLLEYPVFIFQGADGFEFLSYKSFVNYCERCDILDIDAERRGRRAIEAFTEMPNQMGQVPKLWRSFLERMSVYEKASLFKRWFLRRSYYRNRDIDRQRVLYHLHQEHQAMETRKAASESNPRRDKKQLDRLRTEVSKLSEKNLGSHMKEVQKKLGGLRLFQRLGLGWRRDMLYEFRMLCKIAENRVRRIEKAQEKSREERLEELKEVKEAVGSTYKVVLTFYENDVRKCTEKTKEGKTHPEFDKMAELHTGILTELDRVRDNIDPEGAMRRTSNVERGVVTHERISSSSSSVLGQVQADMMVREEERGLYQYIVSQKRQMKAALVEERERIRQETLDQLRKTYKGLALKRHPDRGGDETGREKTEQMQWLNVFRDDAEAYLDMLDGETELEFERKYGGKERQERFIRGRESFDEMWERIEREVFGVVSSEEIKRKIDKAYTMTVETEELLAREREEREAKLGETKAELGETKAELGETKERLKKLEEQVRFFMNQQKGSPSSVGTGEKESLRGEEKEGGSPRLGSTVGE